MKKLIQSAILVFFLMNLALAFQGLANAETIKPVDLIQEVGKETKLPDFLSSGQHPDAPADGLKPGVGTVTSPIFYLIDIFRFIMGGIALIVVIVNAFRLISNSTEDEATKSKNHLMYGIIGLIVIQFADTLVKKMFFGEQGEAFEDIGTAKVFAKESLSQIRGIIGFIEFFLGTVAVLVIIIRGFVLITGSGAEEDTTAAKKHVLYALVGLAIVGLSEVVVRGVVFPESGSALPDVNQGKKVIIALTNYLSSFIAVIAFASLFYAGYLYVTSTGKEEVNEEVKKIFFGAIVAILLSLGAFALVNTLVKFDEPPDSATELPEQLPVPN